MFTFIRATASTWTLTLPEPQTQLTWGDRDRYRNRIRISKDAIAVLSCCYCCCCCYCWLNLCFNVYSFNDFLCLRFDLIVINKLSEFLDTNKVLFKCVCCVYKLKSRSHLHTNFGRDEHFTDFCVFFNTNQCWEAEAQTANINLWFIILLLIS